MVMETQASRNFDVSISYRICGGSHTDFIGVHWPNALLQDGHGWDQPGHGRLPLFSLTRTNSYRPPNPTESLGISHPMPRSSENGNVRSNVTFHLAVLTSLQLAAWNFRLALFTCEDRLQPKVTSERTETRHPPLGPSANQCAHQCL